MKWWHCLVIGAILTALLGLPFHEYETQQLLPMKTVQAVRDKGGVRIVSEIGEGFGQTWTDAVKDLRQKASGEVFFDTAEFAIFSDRALASDAARSGLLRPAARVCFADSVATTDGLQAYLKAHPSRLRIADLMK